MNIFEQEDLIKGLPDQALMKEAQQPTNQVPQYLVISEIKRRQDMRKRFSQQNQDQPEGTVKDQILGGGIAAMGQPDPTMQSAMGAPPPQPPAPMGMPQQMAPPQQPMPMPPQQQGPMPPQGMAAGGVVRMQPGGATPYVQGLGQFHSSVSPLVEQLAMLRGQKGRTDEILDIYGEMENIYKSKGLGRFTQDEKREALLSMASADEIRAAGDSLGLLPNSVERLLQNVEADQTGGSSALDADIARAASNLATKPSTELIEAAVSTKGPMAKVEEDLNVFGGPSMTMTGKELTQNIGQLQAVAGLDPTSRAAALVKQLEGVAGQDANSEAARILNQGQSSLFMPTGNTAEELAASLYDYERPSISTRRGRRPDPTAETREEVMARILGADNVPSSALSPMRDFGTRKEGFVENVSPLLAKYLSGENVEAVATGNGTAVTGGTTGGTTGNLVNVVNTQGGNGQAGAGGANNNQATTFQGLIDELANLGDRPKLANFLDNEDMQSLMAERKALTDRLTTDKSEYLSLFDDLGKADTDYASLKPDYANLISEAERRANKIKEDARKDAGAQALIQLGAGIAEGNVSAGLRGAGKSVTDIMDRARTEASAENMLARRMEMANKEAEMELGIKGKQAANNQLARRQDAILKTYSDDKATELQAIGLKDKALSDQIGLHKSVAEAIYASDLEDYRLKQENAVKRAVMLRYQELEKQSQRSLAKTYLDIMEDELGLMLTDWREKNPKATVEDTTKFLQSLVGQFVTVDSLEGGLDGGNTVNRGQSGAGASRQGSDLSNPFGLNVDPELLDPQ